MLNYKDLKNYLETTLVFVYNIYWEIKLLGELNWLYRRENEIRF